jgi:hypothetical protein
VILEAQRENERAIILALQAAAGQQALALVDR